LQDLKEAQKVAYADLPHPDPWEEVAPWDECKTLGDIAAAAENGKARVPHVTLLRCALADLAAQNKPSTADAIFQTIFSTDLPSLLNIDDAYQVCATSYSHTRWGTQRLSLVAGIVMENAQ